MSRRAQVRRPVQSEIVVIGVDVGKRKLTARALAGDGRIGKRCVFGCDREGFEKLFGYAQRSVERFGAEGFVVAMEPTGHYGEPLAVWLRSRGVRVEAIPPLFTKRAKELHDGTGRKTDDKDALVVAELCRQGYGKPWRIRRGTFAALRELNARRRQLMNRRRAVLNRLHQHRDVLFPEQRELFSKLTGKTSLWVLGHAATPERVQEMGLEELEGQLRRHSRGQLGRARAEAMLQAASRSVGVREAAEVRQLALRQLLEEYEQVERQREQIERCMDQQLRQVPYAGHLLTVPGFGPITVATLLGELGDLRNYRVARQLIKMVGLDLVENSSGQRQGRHRISRRGRRYARQILYMAALAAGQGALAPRRDRLVQEYNKAPQVAVVANACALLRISHALVRDGVDFDAEAYAAAQRRVASKAA